MKTSLHQALFAESPCLTAEQMSRYNGGDLTPSEMHAVEKHLLKCDLCSDAIAGYALSGFTAEDTSLTKRVRALTGNQRRNSASRWLIAASFLGIVGLVSIIFYLKDARQDKVFTHDTARKEQSKLLPTGDAEKSEEKTVVRPNQPASELEESNLHSQMQGAVSASDSKAKGGDHLLRDDDQHSASTLMQRSAKVVENSKDADVSSPVSSESVSIIANQAAKNQSMNDGLVYREDRGTKKEQVAAKEAERMPDSGGAVSQSEDGVTAPVEESVSEMLTTEVQLSKISTANRRKSRVSEQVSPAQGSSAETRGGGESGVQAAGTAAGKAKQQTQPEYLLAAGVDYKVVDTPKELHAQADEKTSDSKATPAMYATPDDKNNSSLDPENKTVQYPYADYLKGALVDMTTGRFAEAEAKFGAMLSVSSDDLNAIFYRAMTQYRAGKYNEAASGFSRVLQHSDRTFAEEGEFYYAKSLLLSSKKSKAFPILKKIAEAKGNYSQEAEKLLGEYKD